MLNASSAKCLFITSNRIGDAVLSTGVLAHLAEKHPDATFTIACGPLAADLFRATPRLERLIILRKQAWNGHWLGLWRDCIGTRWALIVDLRNSIVSRLLWASKRAYGPAHKTGRHKVIDNASALRLDPPPAPHLWLDKQAEDQAARLMPANATVLALGPAANWACKQWPVEKFAELALKLTDSGGALSGARVLITAAPHERAQLAPLFAALPSEQIIDAIGQNLLTVAACLKRCRLFVGNDSGLMHIASAIGTPTLGLFGPGYENVYGPWGKHCAVVRTPESAAELWARLPYRGADHPNLMESLSVEAVVEGVLPLLPARQIADKVAEDIG
jgi:lipopolysaccharide export system permease protein